MFKKIATCLAFMFALSLNHAQAADAGAGKTATTRTRVVIQVSDDDSKKWNLALNNVKNLQQELGAANVDVELVAYGPGINMLKFDSVVADRIDEAAKAGVTILACENSMKSFKLGKADMASPVAYVPSGVVEIIRKQGAGYAYIRP